MHKSTVARLTKLNAKLGKQVDLIAQNVDDDEQSHPLRDAAIGAGAVGAGYAGASLLRGRQWQKKVLGQPDNSVSGLLGALKTGNAQNIQDAASLIAPAADAVKSAAQNISGAAGTAGSVIGNAAGAVADKATQVARSSKASLLLAARRAKSLIPAVAE